MPIWRLQTSFMFDSAFPRDRIVITPHFDDQDVTTSPDDLCSDLADALVTWGNDLTGEVRVTAYDAQGTVPVFPQGEAVRNEGVVANSNVPREVALCLSFYSQQNQPRQRGRLYLPSQIVAASANINVIPTATQIARAMALGPILADLGGTEVDWCVYSRVDDVARPVTNYWVDNEWDHVRSRGLRGTARSVATTSEA